jgi:uracil-DNA glycosylase
MPIGGGTKGRIHLVVDGVTVQNVLADNVFHRDRARDCATNVRRRVSTSADFLRCSICTVAAAIAVFLGKTSLSSFLRCQLVLRGRGCHLAFAAFLFHFRKNKGRERKHLTAARLPHRKLAHKQKRF